MTSRDTGYDRLVGILKSVPPDKLREALVKTEAITIRLSMSDKTGMQLASKACGLTLTDYLIQLHHLVAEKLQGEAEKNGRGPGRMQSHVPAQDRLKKGGADGRKKGTRA
jgi:hypothetical protein